MNDQQLTEFAERYVREVYAECDFSDFEVREQADALVLNCICFAKSLMETHCLVEKEKT